jgi:hypothetical protein
MQNDEVKLPVTVKPLEWGETSYGRPEAFSIIGVYRVNEAINGGWSVVFSGLHGRALEGHDGRTNFVTIDAAKAAAQAHFEAAIRKTISAIPSTVSGETVAWACVKCNSPRSVDPCPKCGTPLTKPADGWEWPGLPDIDRIRALAREVGYAIGVHGSLERDLDLIAAPWVESAIGPYGLALHIAAGLGGEVVDFKNQDKPCGRWSCNIHTPDWTKMIDLSVMPPVANHEARGDGVRVTDEVIAQRRHMCALAGPCSDNGDGCSCSDADLASRVVIGVPPLGDGREEIVEACAKVADEYQRIWSLPTPEPHASVRAGAGMEIAAAIRSLSNFGGGL